MPDKSQAVAVALAIFLGLLAYRSGLAARVGQAINGSLTVGGR
jgi:hypothetical protein